MNHIHIFGRLLSFASTVLSLGKKEVGGVSYNVYHCSTTCNRCEYSGKLSFAERVVFEREDDGECHCSDEYIYVYGEVFSEEESFEMANMWEKDNGKYFSKNTMPVSLSPDKDGDSWLVIISTDREV